MDLLCILLDMLLGVLQELRRPLRAIHGPTGQQTVDHRDRSVLPWAIHFVQSPDPPLMHYGDSAGGRQRGAVGFGIGMAESAVDPGSAAEVIHMKFSINLDVFS